MAVFRIPFRKLFFSCPNHIYIFRHNFLYIRLLSCYSLCLRTFRSLYFQALLSNQMSHSYLLLKFAIPVDLATGVLCGYYLLATLDFDSQSDLGQVESVKKKRARRLLPEPFSNRWDGARHTLVPGCRHLALVRGGKAADSPTPFEENRPHCGLMTGPSPGFYSDEFE